MSAFGPNADGPLFALLRDKAAEKYNVLSFHNSEKSACKSRGRQKKLADRKANNF